MKRVEFMASKAITQITLIVCGAGVLLHLYTVTFKSEGGVSALLVGLLLLSRSPYAVAAALSRSHRGRLLGLGGAAVSWLADISMHYAVFVAPKGSTAALGLLVMPIWNLVAIWPAGAVLLWFAHKRFAGTHDDAS
jgi:hypothetical protein